MMEKDPTLEHDVVEKEVVKNPNSIGEVLSVSKDIETTPDKVYRSVKDFKAIEDLLSEGVVRNAFSAGQVEKSRWGDRVFWSKGAEGKYHILQSDGYVIEAPYAVADVGSVRLEDVTAIYFRNSDGEVVNILDELLEKLRSKYIVGNNQPKEE